MKKSFLILSLFLCVLLCLSACGKTESASQPEPTPTPTVPVLESVLPDNTLSSDAPAAPEGTDSSPAEEPEAPSAEPSEEAAQTGSEQSPDAPEVPVENQFVIGGDQMAAAQNCIGKSVAELYEAIGEPPQGSDYAPSCLNPGKGEDGELYYDGFTVATYREGDTETVRDVVVTINVG